MYMQNLILIRNIVVFATLLLLPNSIWAIKSDAKQVVLIDADSVEFSKSQGKAVYQGNVSIKQGTLKIKASRIQINAPKGKIISIVATGYPLTVEQKMDNGKLAKGKAKQMRYLVSKNRLILSGNAVVSQGADQFSSNYIEFSTLTGALKAGNKKNNKSRVHAVFHPSTSAK